MSSLFRIQGEIPEKTAGGVTHVPRGGRDGAADSAGGVARGGGSQRKDTRLPLSRIPRTAEETVPHAALQAGI